MSRDLRTRVRACALEGNTPLERFARPPSTSTLLKCLAAAHGGQLRAVQTCWGSRHDLSPLDRSARALRSGTPGAILHKGCRRFRQRGVRRGRPLSGLCEDASQHMVILHVMSPRQRGDGPALHQVPCAPLLLVLGPTSATQEARRQVLRQGWTELARAEGAGFRWSRSSRPGWSLLWREKSAQLHGPEVFCVNGRRMQPVMSIQMMSGSCERCCVGPSSVAQQLATGQAGDFFQLEDEAWGCAAQDNSSCISRIRRLLSCQQIREEDLGGVDWLSLREQMRRALVYAREGQVDGFKEGLHGQLHKITFEAEYGDFMLDMGREDWITKFRGLFAQHLTNPEKAPGCLLGHATLQLFMLFFVDSRGHGLFPKELAPRASWSSSLEERAVCYSDFVEPEMWNLPNVLATRLRLLRAVRWMNLLESGWPIFKILSLAACRESEVSKEAAPVLCKMPRGASIRLAEK
ncbi:unnamed protein product [Effrenium voratum]|nr:unnamed protein product [Effrenium voratum]